MPIVDPEKFFIVRVEFQDVKTAPTVYDHFYTRIAGSIFVDQLQKYDGINSTYHDLAPGTYFAKGNMSAASVLQHAKEIAEQAIADAQQEYDGTQLTTNVTVFELEPANTIQTTIQATPRKSEY